MFCLVDLTKYGVVWLMSKCSNYKESCMKVYALVIGTAFVSMYAMEEKDRISDIFAKQEKGTSKNSLGKIRKNYRNKLIACAKNAAEKAHIDETSGMIPEAQKIEAALAALVNRHNDKLEKQRTRGSRSRPNEAFDAIQSVFQNLTDGKLDLDNPLEGIKVMRAKGCCSKEIVQEGALATLSWADKIAVARKLDFSQEDLDKVVVWAQLGVQVAQAANCCTIL